MASINDIRAAFPYFSQGPGATGYVYLDNAATTQKPFAVLEAMNQFYIHSCANIHRGVHRLSQSASIAFEDARGTTAQYFGVNNPQQIIFTSGATESINLLAQGLAKSHLKPGDSIMLSVLEHHANFLPWQEWAHAHQGTLKTLPLTSDFEIHWPELESHFKSGIALLSITAVSNTLGIRLPLEQIINMAKRYGVPVCIDAAQLAAHQYMNLDTLQPDFLVCSAHKLYGPTGTGILYLAPSWLNSLPISKTGGGAISKVSWEKTEYVDGALRYEAGTPNIAGVLGFAAALKKLQQWDLATCEKYEQQCLNYLEQQLIQIPEIIVYAQGKPKIGSLSFNVKGHHAFDVGSFLDRYQIAVRTGHHCTQPLMTHLNVSGTIRVSVGIYTSQDDINAFINALKKTLVHLLKYHA